MLETGFGRGYLAVGFTDRECMADKRFAGEDSVAAYETGEVEHTMTPAGFHRVDATSGKDRHRTFTCLETRKKPEPTEDQMSPQRHRDIPCRC